MSILTSTELAIELLNMVPDDGEETVNAPLIGTVQDHDDQEPHESDSTSPNAFIWMLTLVTGISGLLFGYECAFCLLSLNSNTNWIKAPVSFPRPSFPLGLIFLARCQLLTRASLRRAQVFLLLLQALWQEFWRISWVVRGLFSWRIFSLLLVHYGKLLLPVCQRWSPGGVWLVSPWEGRA